MLDMHLGCLVVFLIDSVLLRLNRKEPLAVTVTATRGTPTRPTQVASATASYPEEGVGEVLHDDRWQAGQGRRTWRTGHPQR